MRKTQPIIAALPRIAPTIAPRGEQATLTVIDTATRRVVSVHEAFDRDQALAIFRALGEGYCAHIRTPKYFELIVPMKNGN